MRRASPLGYEISQICRTLEVSSEATTSNPLLSGSHATALIVVHFCVVIGLSVRVSTFTSNTRGKLSVPFCPTQAINFPSGDHDGFMALQKSFGACRVMISLSSDPS